jgi:hypothetical protein
LLNGGQVLYDSEKNNLEIFSMDEKKLKEYRSYKSSLGAEFILLGVSQARITDKLDTISGIVNLSRSQRAAAIIC